MTTRPQRSTQQPGSIAARQARIQQLTQAIAEGWYRIPDDVLAEAILKRTGITEFPLPAPDNPAAP